MAIATHNVPSISLQISSIASKPQKRFRPPIFISTNPSHINPLHLRDLFSSSNLSCHRFPNLDSEGRVEPVDLNKLQIALSHSSVVVSVFCKPVSISYENCPKDEPIIQKSELGFGELFERAIPVTESNGTLVGFGRAVSDNGLTASIHDVVVLPSLRGLGIGRMIVKRILRVLTSRDIYDIAALCSEKERWFFEACGFGDDILGSTTMMYTRNPSSCDTKSDQMVTCAGRMLLLVPPSRKNFSLKSMSTSE
ncbi:GNAT domain [Macleaya cordata]|uniref:GNAT domain n=1 Tax=Macleaya cordata TaxID=56857 RepID=A0A200PVI7_MACCD|nr:GNAT domain [Macleaya cordata]